jgi:hypothetical protein
VLTPAKSEDSVSRQQRNSIYSRGTCLLDVVVREGPAVLELLAGEDEALLVRGNAGHQKNCRKLEPVFLSALVATMGD